MKAVDRLKDPEEAASAFETLSEILDHLEVVREEISELNMFDDVEIAQKLALNLYTAIDDIYKLVINEISKAGYYDEAQIIKRKFLSLKQPLE